MFNPLAFHQISSKLCKSFAISFYVLFPSSFSEWIFFRNFSRLRKIDGQFCSRLGFSFRILFVLFELRKKKRRKIKNHFSSYHFILYSTKYLSAILIRENEAFNFFRCSTCNETRKEKGRTVVGDRNLVVVPSIRRRVESSAGRRGGRWLNWSR